jgi:hypothetical protein
MPENALPTKITMYLGSMDHSPTEQLAEDPQQWHTTVIILSEGGEHFQLAKSIAEGLGLKDGRLRKWSRNPSYRKNGTFEAVLMKEIRKYPVFIRAISAESGTIRACYTSIVSQLGLSGLVTTFTKNEKPYLKFGPFTRVKFAGESQGQLTQILEPAEFEIIERQALSLLFICHFVLRTHQVLMPIIVKARPEIEWIDWQLMPNKFPGDYNGPMGSLFHAIMSGAAHSRLVAGNIRIMTFAQSADDEGSSLADNIAGNLTERLQKRQPTALVECGDALHWESWHREDSIIPP